MRTAGDVSSLTARGEDRSITPRGRIASFLSLLFAVFAFVNVPLGPADVYAASTIVSDDRHRKLVQTNLSSQGVETGQVGIELLEQDRGERLSATLGADDALSAGSPPATERPASRGARPSGLGDAFILEFVVSAYASRGPPAA